jgi:poly(3-hydroxybutyrate) depolymerase
MLNISDAVFNDLRAIAKDSKDPLYASAHVFSADGGRRFFFIRTYSPFKLYLNGQPVAEAPAQDKLDPPQRAVLNLVKGMNEITLELTPQEGVIILCYLLEAPAPEAQLRPNPGDVIIIPSAKGKPADANAAAFKGLAVGPGGDVPFVGPGAKTVLGARLRGSRPRGTGVLTARVLGAGGGPPGPEVTLPVNAPAQVEYVAPKEPRGVYEARVEILGDGKSLGIKTVSLICPEGFTADALALERDWKDRSAKSGRSLPNAKLYIEKLKLYIDGIMQGTVDPDAETGREMLEVSTSARAFLDTEAQGKDPFEGKSGYRERGYVSAIDGGVQPYIESVPPAAVAQNTDTFPLVVFLHGYDPNMNKHRWWEAKDYAAVCTRHSCFMAIPFGRLNTDFQSVGEVDVLDVIKEMKAHYRIDPARVYLVGISMGGMGVYTMAAHYPDEFAAGLVIAGRADSPLQNMAALEKFHPFKQWLIHADNPVSLVDNLVNVPLRIYHGADDFTVPPAQAHRMAAALKKAGCDAKLFLLPGGHRAGFDLIRDDEPLKWLLTNKRNDAPAARKMKQYSLAFAKQDRVEVSAIRGALEPIELDWTDTNGKKQFTKESSVIRQKKVDGEAQPALNAPLLKTRELCGPVRQAICAPFTIVYGTKGSAQANAENKKNAQRFAEEWLAFTRSEAQLKADVDVTDAEKRERNLFLFGEEQDNALHAQIANTLPISVKNGTVTIAGKAVPLAGKGLMFIYPSALAANKRAVVICAGIPYGEKIGVNHKLDLIPDFLLYTSTPDIDTTNTNKATCAGFFDGEWKIDPKAIWWFD